MNPRDLRAEAARHVLLRQEILTAYPELSEDDPAILDTLQGETALQECVVAVVRLIDEDRALHSGLSQRMVEMQERLDRLSDRMAKLRDLIGLAMEQANLKKIVEADFTVSLSARSPRVVIVDENQLPRHLMVVPEPPPPRPDKVAIAGLLKGGVAVPGAALSNAPPTISIRRK